MQAFRYLLVILLFTIIFASCSKEEKKSETAEADSSFMKLSSEYIKGYLQWRPQSGTYLGLHEYDGKITDYSKSSVSKEIARLKDFKERLSKLDTMRISRKVNFDYRILKAEINKELFDFEDMKSYSKNPMTYAGAIDVNIYVKRNFAPIEERVKSIIAIEKNAGGIFAAAKENLDEALPKPYIETAIQVAQGSADFLSRDLPSALSSVKNDALMKDFTDANNNAIAEIKNYITYLQKEKLPKANNDFAIGTENYKKMLWAGEYIDYTPDRLLNIGLMRLREEQKQFQETAHIIDPNKNAVDVFKEIQKDHPTAESLIPDTRKNMDAIRQFVIDNHIVKMPSDVKAQVEETPQYLRATSFASMDTPGPFETKATEAYYYVTPVDPKWSAKQKDEWLTAFNYYTTDVVSIHEAYPGHYTQFLHLNASNATMLEKLFGSYAYTEGWAHYSEQMLIDEGFGKDKDSITAAKYRLAQLDESLMRLCRLCVSIKLHTQGVSIDDAVKFFMDNCYYEKQPSTSEVIRGTFDPGYLYYTIGKLEILKLREDYKTQEGAGFSLERFHNLMLDNGMPPIVLLRELLLKDDKNWKNIF